MYLYVSSHEADHRSISAPPHGQWSPPTSRTADSVDSRGHQPQSINVENVDQIKKMDHPSANSKHAPQSINVVNVDQEKKGLDAKGAEPLEGARSPKPEDTALEDSHSNTRGAS